MSGPVSGHGFRWGWHPLARTWATWCPCGWVAARDRALSARTARQIFEGHKDDIRRARTRASTAEGGAKE